MKKMAVRFLVVLCTAALLSGCSSKTEVLKKEAKDDKKEIDVALESEFYEVLEEESQTTEENEPEVEIEKEAEPEEQSLKIIKEEEVQEEESVQTQKEPEEGEEKSEASKAPTETKSQIPYEVQNIMSLVKRESEIDQSKENRKQVASENDLPPEDTIAYMPSKTEEEVEMHQVESEVDENDPSTYQIIKKEQEVEETMTYPTKYVNPSGEVRYALLEDGIWYEYKYSSGDVTLDERDEELALLLLNMDGSYDGFEIDSIECVEVSDEDNSTQYEYHVRYRKASALDGEPKDTEMLIAGGIRETKSVRTEVIEEKVPILIKEPYKTGRLIYYGWQEIDGEYCYYEEHTGRVTGEQVIQGIRYKFNEDGILTSHTGIEVSSACGEIDWEAVRAAGVDFAYLRCAYRGCGQGELILDAKLEEYTAGAKAAGITVGFYLDSQAVSLEEAVEEANLAVLLAEQYGVTEPVALLLSDTGWEGLGRADSLSVEDRTAFANTFCQTVQEAGYTPMIHTEKDWMEEHLHLETLSTYPLWLTQYDTEVTYAGPYEIWQYTTKGTIDGIDALVGLSIRYGR